MWGRLLNMKRVMIQIRNVPEPIRRKLKVRAAHAGLTLSEYLLRQITPIAERPTLDEFSEWVRSQETLELPVSVAAMVRQDRESH